MVATLAAGALDRKVQFSRAGTSDNGFAKVEGPFVAYGPIINCRRKDVSDGERMRAQQVDSDLAVRVVVRWSVLTRSLTAADRFAVDGDDFAIVGIKEGEGRRKWLEISGKELGPGE